MPSVPHFRWWIVAVLAVALALRLAAGAWWQQRLPQGSNFAFGDSEGYWELARTIARRQPYEYSHLKYKVFRTPGYPLVLSPLFLVREQPPVAWGRALSAFLGTAAVGLVMWLGQLLFDQRVALVAGGVAALYPEAIAASVFVLSEAPFSPLMLGATAAWISAWKAIERGPLVGWAIAGGVLAGLATLMRPSFLLFVPFAAAVGLAAGPFRVKQTLVSCLLGAGLCLAMLPWWVRNCAVAGRFVPTSLQVGASLYDGLSPSANGGSEMSFVRDFVREQRAADAAALAAGRQPAGLFEDRLDRRMQSAALDWTRRHPGRALELAWIKLLRMWSPLPNAADFRSAPLRRALALSYTPVLLLAMAGIWKYARRDWPYLLLVLPAIYFTLLHVVFVSSIRYRQPAMLTLIVLAAAVLVEIWGRSAQPPHFSRFALPRA